MMIMAQSAPPNRSPRQRILKLHRWISLAAAAFWLVQALTGIAILFHWEIADAAYPSPHEPTDLARIEQRIDAIQSGGATVKTIWTTAGAADRYTINLDKSSVLISGDGTVLRPATIQKPALMGTLVGIHHDLLGGKLGSWIVSISGILLLSNLALGLIAAWPRRRAWKAALAPARKGPLPARVYSWHRAIGLWGCLPALLVVVTGTMLKFEDGVGYLIGARPITLPAVPRTGDPVGFAAAAGSALSAIPGSTLTMVRWPGEDDATYSVRVRAPGEIRRAYGASVVLVDANTGAVRGTYPIAQAEPARGFMSALFPIHTGEFGGLAGRLFSALVGLWLMGMIVLGTMLWIKRRKSGKV
ncbi:MAG: PepSY-associated TM helix domain-containing protein [Novosphingobium sp.]